MNKENTMPAGENRANAGSNLCTKKYDKTDGLFRIVYVLLGFCFVRFFIFYDWGTNFCATLPLFTAGYIATVLCYGKSRNIPLSKESLFWIGIMAVNRLLFKTERFFRLLIQICLGAYFTSVTGGLFENGTSRWLAVDLTQTFITKPFSNFFSIFPAFFTLFKKSGKKEKQPVHPAVWGAVAGIGAMWFILPLLTKADSNFLSGTTDFISHIFAVFNNRNFVENMVILFFSAPVTMYMFGLGYGCFNNNDLRDMTKGKVYKTREDMRISPALTLKVFMYIICAAYILFMILQIRYLFGVFTGNLYPGMTYSRYARSGFFELCKVAGINLSVLAGCNLPAKKGEDYKSAQLLLCVLSLLLLSTAAAKMAMYMTVYGLTYKRVVSSVFLLALVTVFLLCIARLYKNFNLVKTAVMICAVMFSILFSFDISYYCYRFNRAFGYEEKAPQIEYTGVYNSLILPDKKDVTVIEAADSQGNPYKQITAAGEIIDLLTSSIDTEKISIQDFPVEEDYYTLTIFSVGNDSPTTVYIYRQGDYFYIEQPYYLICRSDLNWDSILMPYRS